MNSYDQLTQFHLDVLREIGNIGMGNAATALSQMVNNKVDMTIPEVCILNQEQSNRLLDLLKNDSLGVILRLSEGIDGYILHFLRKSFAERIIGFFFDAGQIDLMNLDEMSMSVISEVGNITSASYVNAIASMTNFTIDISPPEKCNDFNSQTCFFAEKEEKKLLFVDTSFYIDDEKIRSNLFFAPDKEGIIKILKHLGI